MLFAEGITKSELSEIERGLSPAFNPSHSVLECSQPFPDLFTNRFVS
jgi:hypothetical protein